MYAMLGTRPDIAYTVSVMSQFHSNPNQTHWNILKRTFQYLKETIELGILYGNMNELKLERFSNSDWRGNINSRKSTNGYIFKLRNGAISWSSILQQTIALSIMEVEYIVVTYLAKEVI